MQKNNLFYNEGEAYDGAQFTVDNKYRIQLWRIWKKDLPKAMYIGLNPSTANEDTDDRTITRIKNFSADHGYGGFFMLNLFQYVTAYPERLRNRDIIYDSVNRMEQQLLESAHNCKDIIFCWGAFTEAKQRSPRVIELFPDALCFGKTADGSPKHPLFLHGSTRLIKFNS